MRKRLAQYKEQTEPLIDYYTDKGLLADVDATKKLDEIVADVKAAINA